MAATCRDQYSRVGPHLFLAFELSGSNWKLGFTIGFGQRPRERNIRAGDLDALEREIGQAKERFGLPEDVPVLSCYEAGRDGFWLHRFLESIDVRNLVVDSSSIEVNRRRRRAKTDSLDVEKLLTMLLRYHGREKKVWHVVHVPTVEQEDHRQLHREMMALKKERTRHINRIKALLAGQGVRMQVRKDFLQQLDATRLWNGSRLPEGLKALLKREHERFQLVEEQIAELERERMEAIQNSGRPDVQMVRDLLRLRAIGVHDGVLRVAQFPYHPGTGQPEGDRGSVRADANTVAERLVVPGAGDREIRQSLCTRDGDRDRLPSRTGVPPVLAARTVGVVEISAREQADPVVRGAIRSRRQQNATHRDRCSGEEALDRALALPGNRSDPRRSGAQARVGMMIKLD